MRPVSVSLGIAAINFSRSSPESTRCSETTHLIVSVRVVLRQPVCERWLSLFPTCSAAGPCEDLVTGTGRAESPAQTRCTLPLEEVLRSGAIGSDDGKATSERSSAGADGDRDFARKQSGGGSAVHGVCVGTCAGCRGGGGREDGRRLRQAKYTKGSWPRPAPLCACQEAYFFFAAFFFPFLAFFFAAIVQAPVKE